MSAARKKLAPGAMPRTARATRTQPGDSHQLEFSFTPTDRNIPVGVLERAPGTATLQSHGRDLELETKARKLLHSLGARRLSENLRVEWNERMRTAAGRADPRRVLISLNPRLSEHGTMEIDRTLRHELAHLLAQSRAGRRRISPHGAEWRRACCDLEIGDEARCHNLPFPVSQRSRRFLYRCPSCHVDYPRVRRIRRAIACLACCRRHNSGHFDGRFRLKLVQDKMMV